ncbi:MAG TPA: hypothetical protein H9752_10415 [Candidatus Phocaeicola excrementigallinarum]|nr:hypothetical protein [Candidatus Phocaeicola excrementigallinarum]
MKAKKYFMIPFLALLACGCQDEERITMPLASGEEVQFGATLGQNATSRTIYGTEENNAFPIYWVNGDEVIVSSPECGNSNGVGSANYRVTVEGNSQDYATSLDKTGDIGVRWGDNSTGTFYSMYPASAEHTKLGSDFKTVTLTMPAQQDNNYKDENGVKTILPDMNACFMYAKTADVPSGETVELKYKPLSTALRFNVVGPVSGEVTINYIRVYAPEGTSINGTYSVDLSTATDDALPAMTPVRGLNYVTFNVADSETGAYLTLGSGERFEVNAFLLLAEETEITDKWYIEIGTSAGISYKKYLDGIAVDGKNKTLVPGKVHRLPDLPPLSESPEWDAANWMANLQRNVYLSEISIPGSWYSLNGEYQTRNSISTQYSAGVRAFHIDTRWRADREYILFPPHFEYTITDLGVADNGDTYDVEGDDGKEGKCMTQSSPTFKSVLDQITEKVAEDEYMVVMCTFAQGSTVHGDWRKAISDACADNAKVIEASSLNENTVVGDVLGKVIVIVNTFTEGEVAGSKCLFFNMGITLAESDWSNLSDPNKYYHSPLTWYNTTSSGITMYGTHAQITTDGDSYDGGDRGWVPSFADRKQMATNILNWSKSNYSDIENYAHNAWIYLGLGGYIPGTGWGSDDAAPVAKELNQWIGNIVTNMNTEADYYPVGIVFMNYATDYSSVVNDILMLNNKYRKAYDPNRSPVDGEYITGGGGSPVQSAAAGYSSGMTDNNTDAIGWTRCR